VKKIFNQWKGNTSLLARCLILVLLLFVGNFADSANADSPYLARIPKSVDAQGDALLSVDEQQNSSQDEQMNLVSQYLQFNVLIDKNVPREERNKIKEHLLNTKNYSFSAGWPNVESLEELRTPNPPFSLRKEIEFKDESFTNGLTNSNELTRMRFRLRGISMKKSRGIVTIKALENWQFIIDNDPKNTQVDGFMYASSPEVTIPRFTSDPVRLSAGGNAFVLEYKGEGILNQPKTDTIQNAKKPLILSEVMVRYPITIPRDVKNVIGASKDASGVVADIIQIGVKSLQYTQNGGLKESGGRFRVSGTGKGAELVGYYSPTSQLSTDNRQFYALEFEGGWRQGDAEWKNLTTRAPDTGHLVARAGVVLEWAPEIRGTGINRNITPSAPGLKFFIRERFWLDSINEGKQWRGRGYLDSELFYNFSSQSRVYLRYEAGQSLPDLSRYVKRVSLGVGKAF
jgi:hypothetical protein